MFAATRAHGTNGVACIACISTAAMPCMYALYVCLTCMAYVRLHVHAARTVGDALHDESSHGYIQTARDYVAAHVLDGDASSCSSEPSALEDSQVAREAGGEADSPIQTRKSDASDAELRERARAIREELLIQGRRRVEEEDELLLLHSSGEDRADDSENSITHNDISTSARAARRCVADLKAQREDLLAAETLHTDGLDSGGSHTAPRSHTVPRRQAIPSAEPTASKSLVIPSAELVPSCPAPARRGSRRAQTEEDEPWWDEREPDVDSADAELTNEQHDACFRSQSADSREEEKWVPGMFDGGTDQVGMMHNSERALEELQELREAQGLVKHLESQLLSSSEQLRQAAEEIDGLVEHNVRLEHKLSDTGLDLHDARSHVSRHDLALQVLEKDVADARVAKRSADNQLSQAEDERERLQHKTRELQALLAANQQALVKAEQGSIKDAEAAEALMQETAARLDKVQAAWTRAQDKAKTLSQHSKKIASQLHDKGVALASAQAAQELALARVRALEAERLHLKQVIRESEEEKAHHSVIIENLAAAQREREQEKAAAASMCEGLESKVAALEAQLLDKDKMLHSMQQLLHESASSHRSLAADLQLLEQRAAPAQAQHDSFNRSAHSTNNSHSHLTSPPPQVCQGGGGARLGSSEEVVTCEVLFTLAFSDTPDALLSPRLVVLSDSVSEHPHMHRTPPAKEKTTAVTDGLVKTQTGSQHSPDAIVASDSPIKGIIFSRVVTDAQHSPRRASRVRSPRCSLSQSPRGRNVEHSEVQSANDQGQGSARAALTAELGFIAAEVLLGQDESQSVAVDRWQTFDLSSSSFTPRSLHSVDTANASRLPPSGSSSARRGEGASAIDAAHELESLRSQLVPSASRRGSTFETAAISPRVVPARVVPYSDTRAGGGGMRGNGSGVGDGGGGRSGVPDSEASRLPISGSFHSITRLQASVRRVRIRVKYSRMLVLARVARQQNLTSATQDAPASPPTDLEPDLSLSILQVLKQKKASRALVSAEGPNGQDIEQQTLPASSDATAVTNSVQHGPFQAGGTLGAGGLGHRQDLTPFSEHRVVTFFRTLLA